MRNIKRAICCLSLTCFTALLFCASFAFVQAVSLFEEALKVPSTKPTLPVSIAKNVSPKVLKAMQTSGSHDAFLKGDYPHSAWINSSFAKDMPIANSRQWDAIWADGATLKHGNLFQGLYVDPMRELAGIWFSTSPVSGNPDLLPGYIRQMAKKLRGSNTVSRP